MLAQLSFEGRRRIENSIQSEKANHCTDVQGNIIPIRVGVTLTVRVGEDEAIVSFLVIESSKMPSQILLGTDALRELGTDLHIG